MAKNLEELLRERPGDPVAQAEHKLRMLAVVRARQLRELRAMWRMRAAVPEPRHDM